MIYQTFEIGVEKRTREFDFKLRYSKSIIRLVCFFVVCVLVGGGSTVVVGELGSERCTVALCASRRAHLCKEKLYISLC